MEERNISQKEDKQRRSAALLPSDVLEQLQTAHAAKRHQESESDRVAREITEARKARNLKRLQRRKLEKERKRYANVCVLYRFLLYLS